MKKRRSGNVKKNKRKISFPKINVRKVVLSIFVILTIIYTIYFLVLGTMIKIEDPTASNFSQGYLLSSNTNDLEKTLIVFESGFDDDRKIADAYLLLYNANKEISMMIHIPGYIYFNDLEEEFGTPIQVSSLRYAGDFLQKGRGVEYALAQFSQLLGIKFNNYIWLTSEALTVLRESYGDINDTKEIYKQSYILDDENILTDEFLRPHSLGKNMSAFRTYFEISNLKNLTGNLYSNMSLSKVYAKLGSWDSIAKNTSSYALDVSSAKMLEEEIADTGGQRSSLNIKEFDKTFRNFYSKVIDRGLEEERVRVEVYNGSGITGIAYQLGRKIVNSGCDVVRYGNAPSLEEKTVIYVPNKEDFSNSYEVVSEILSGPFTVVEGRPSFMTTGDIVIILGEDIKLVYGF